jgi:hypothetical protein
MQWQLIPETTMHAFDINALLTMIVINKLTDVKTINAAVKTHVVVSEKLTIIFFGLKDVNINMQR